MTRGGKRKGAGRPKGAVTTGMASTPPVHFRVSAAQHAELVAEGCKAKPKKLSANAVAKVRCFPKEES